MCSNSVQSSTPTLLSIRHLYLFFFLLCLNISNSLAYSVHPKNNMLSTVARSMFSNRMSFATRHSLKCASTTSSNDEAKTIVTTSELESILPPLYLAEGLMAVEKPIDWTSQDVVSYVRGILERDARERGAKVSPIRRRSNKGKMKIKVGHGGSLDPLATGVLVLGVGRGTKELQQ